MGIENRNLGYRQFDRFIMDKDPVEYNGRKWEPYTQEQIVCNINLGRLVNGFVDGQLEPDLILPHSAVCSVKSDTGSNYPIRKVRNAIFNDTPIGDLEFLKWFKPAPVYAKEDNDSWWEINKEPRDDSLGPMPQFDIKGLGSTMSDDDMKWLAYRFWLLGYNSGPENPHVTQLHKFTRWFQRSTHYYSDPSRHLKIDGDPGPKTKAAVKKRLKELNLHE